MSNGAGIKVGELVVNGLLRLLGFGIMGVGGLGINTSDFFGRMVFNGFACAFRLRVLGRFALDELRPSLYTKWSRDMIQGSLGEIVAFLDKPLYFFLCLLMFLGVLFLLVFHLNSKKELGEPGTGLLKAYKRGYYWITLGVILILLFSLFFLKHRLILSLVFLLLLFLSAFYILLNAHDLRQGKLIEKCIWIFCAASMVVAFVVFPPIFGRNVFDDNVTLLEEFDSKEAVEPGKRVTFLLKHPGKDPSESPALICQYYLEQGKVLRFIQVTDTSRYREFDPPRFQRFRQVIDGTTFQAPEDTTEVENVMEFLQFFK